MHNEEHYKQNLLRWDRDRARIDTFVRKGKQLRYDFDSPNLVYVKPMYTNFHINYFLQKIQPYWNAGLADMRVKKKQAANPQDYIQPDTALNNELFGELPTARHNPHCVFCMCVAHVREWDVFFCYSHPRVPAYERSKDGDPCFIMRDSSIIPDEYYATLRQVHGYLQTGMRVNALNFQTLERTSRIACLVMREMGEFGLQLLAVDERNRAFRRESLHKTERRKLRARRAAEKKAEQEVVQAVWTQETTTTGTEAGVWVDNT